MCGGTVDSFDVEPLEPVEIDGAVRDPGLLEQSRDLLGHRRLAGAKRSDDENAGRKLPLVHHPRRMSTTSGTWSLSPEPHQSS